MLFFPIIGCSDSFSPLLQRCVREGNDAKKHSNSQLYLFLTKRTQVNATHAQLLEKIETNNCFFRNLPISNDPEDIWQKKNVHVNDLSKNLNFDIREFLRIQKMTYSQLRKSPMSKSYENSVDRRDLM